MDEKKGRQVGNSRGSENIVKEVDDIQSDKLPEEKKEEMRKTSSSANVSV